MKGIAGYYPPRHCCKKHKSFVVAQLLRPSYLAAGVSVTDPVMQGPTKGQLNSKNA